MTCIKEFLIKMTQKQQKNSQSPQSMDGGHLRLHYETIVLLYVMALYVSYRVLSLSEAQKDLIGLLSTGAILATFGSAIGAIGLIWQEDLFERVRLNVDILYRDITNQKTPWRRWPFLARAQKQKMLNGGALQHSLSNPTLSLDVGTHVIKVDLPTVLEDFFDLPLIKNYWQLWRFRRAAYTFFGERNGDAVSEKTGLTPSDSYMAYQCMLDIWKSIFRFRISRYVVHFGSGLTICGALIVVIDIWLFW